MSLTANEYRRRYKDVSTQLTLLAGVDPDTDPWIAGVGAETIYMQRIVANITTDAAVTITFQDDAGTPVVIGIVKASIGLGSHVIFDGGEQGVGLTEGKGLDIVGSAAGYAGQLKVEAYRKATGVRNMGTVGARQAITAN